MFSGKKTVHAAIINIWLPFSNAAIMIINIHCKFNKLKIKKTRIRIVYNCKICNIRLSYLYSINQ